MPVGTQLLEVGDRQLYGFWRHGFLAGFAVLHPISPCALWQPVQEHDGIEDLPTVALRIL
jgi:hypothetical protein